MQCAAQGRNRGFLSLDGKECLTAQQQIVCALGRVVLRPLQDRARDRRNLVRVAKSPAVNGGSQRFDIRVPRQNRVEWLQILRGRQELACSAGVPVQRVPRARTQPCYERELKCGQRQVVG